MMTLDDLASDWLAPRNEEDFSLPAIVNFHGMVQAAFNVAGIQNWICAPTGMGSTCALLYERVDGRFRRVAGPLEFRWRAYQIERRVPGVLTTTRMIAGKPAVAQEIEFERAGEFALVFRGLARTWSFTDYWNLPPEDVPQMNVRASEGGFALSDVKTFGRAEFVVGGTRAVYSDTEAWLEGEPPSARGRAGVAVFRVQAGDRIRWHAVQGCEEELARVDAEREWNSARDEWNDVWQSVFARTSRHFGGSLPRLTGPLERLYSMGLLTLLQCRRHVPIATRRSKIATGGQCIWNAGDFEPLDRAYSWGGPEGAPTTLFLWELEFQAPLLARLDPQVLRRLLEAMIRVDLGKHWGIELLSGRGAGMGYGVNPGAFLSCMSDYVRFTGDREFALEHLDFLRACCRPGLTDYGSYENILECVSTYEHSIAAFNALNVKGMRFVAELANDGELARQAGLLAKEVLALHAGGPFACRQPDGSERTVKTILDFVYVGLSMTDDVPEAMRRSMLRFFESELMTADWAYALAPSDPNALTRFLPDFQTYRADHQATGSYDGWPARAAAVMARFGERGKSLAWLARVQALTREGPFGQAHFIHPDGARKASFFNGNCYFESAGSAFATTLLDEFGHA